MIRAMTQPQLRFVIRVSQPTNVGRRALNLVQLHSAHSVAEGLRR
jgi:hypothetical protein